MGTVLTGSLTAVILGGMLLAAPSARAQQAALPSDTAPPVSDLAPQAGIGGGGYGAAHLFSPFPQGGAVMPPSLQVPGLTPAIDAPRLYNVKLGLGGEEKWSDNVFSTSSATKSDFITSVEPSVGVDVSSQRLKGGLNYTMGYDKYAESSKLDGVRQNGIGTFDAELINQTLFLGGRASVSQQTISPTGAVTADDRTAASNAVEVYTTSIAPRFQHSFGDWALGQVSYHHDSSFNENASQVTPVSSSALSAANLNDSQTDGGRFEVRSGPSFSKLLWDYSSDLDHNVSGGSIYDQMSQTIGAEYKLNENVGFPATIGDDYLHNNLSDLSKYGGAFYDAGLHWTPSPNTDFRMGLGRRYDSTNLNLLIEHHLGPMTLVRLSQDTGVTTDALAYEQALNSVQRDESGGFVNPFSGLTANPSSSPFARSNSIYRQRTTNLVLRHDEVRDSLALTAQIAEQQVVGGPSTASAAASTGTSSTVIGGTLSWMHHFTPTTSSVATLSQSDTMASDNALGGSTRLQGNLAMNHNLNETLIGTFGYSYAATIAKSTGGIRENLLSAGLRKTF